MRVTVTGATGLIGTMLVRALRARGDEVTMLSRDPQNATRALDVPAELWQPEATPAPASALEGREGVVHLAGAPVAQRWTDQARAEILSSRELGTRNLVAGLQSLAQANAATPSVLVSASGVGYYGDRGDALLDESAASGADFLAQVCVAWEREARRAAELGIRVATLRTGVVLDSGGGALAKMLLPFRLGVGGPVAGGRQYVAWIHVDDLVGLYLATLDGESWGGALNATAPEPATNRELSKALGRALHRPAIMPVPALALRLLYGSMARIVTDSQRAVPRRALELGYRFAHTDLDEALRSALD